MLAESVIALFGVAWAPSANAQTGAKPEGMEIVWPNTPAGQWAKAYVEAYNAPGRDASRRFVKEYFSEAYLRENPLEKVVSDMQSASTPESKKVDVRVYPAEDRDE